MQIIERLEEGKIYHIYNRGINGTDIFNEKRNYYHFLDKYQEYCSGILETYAYALLKNHFHLLVKVMENIIIPRNDGKGEIQLNASKQLSHFFNSYVQSFNNAYSRHGKLLEVPFNRKRIESDAYFTSLIYYIHFNPQHHQFVTDFRNWEFTSWHNILDNSPTFISREKVLDWFGSKKHFTEAHFGNMPLNNIVHQLFE